MCNPLALILESTDMQKTVLFQNSSLIVEKTEKNIIYSVPSISQWF